MTFLKDFFSYDFFPLSIQTDILVNNTYLINL